VTIFDPASKLLPPGEWTVPMIRAHYLYALGQRTPDVPVDGNHLAYRFMPPVLEEKFGGVLLNGYSVVHIDESYDGPNGWVLQVVLDDESRLIDRDGNRVHSIDRAYYRILTGTVEHWMDGVTVSPGTYTAPLLR
jgi:hypothetical protein